MSPALDVLFRAPTPLSLAQLALPTGLRVLVLAPHPDDFDAIAVTLQHLHRNGQDLHVAVLTAGANGVEDGWNGASSVEQKAALREEEQRASCRAFGLPADRLRFLRLWESVDGVRDDLDHETLRQCVLEHRPDLVFLPHGNDSNRTHRRTYDSFMSIAAQERLSLWACLNLDAKTLAMRPDLYVYFDETQADWKAGLLRMHRSQQERNLASRGIGFDQRVLNVNRDAAAKANGDQPYAEVFELMRLGDA
jgi:LmbE family N-acetylglucosaminyl deacetylase